MSKTIYERSAELHKVTRGKVEIDLKVSLSSKEDLSLAYTPGVAEPCRIIHKNEDLVYDYTWKGNSVAVVTDGSAILGLGNIGPKAGLPVMEGKAALFKKFAGIDAVPICLDTQDTEEIIKVVKAIAPGFGGINLEDISAPRCVEIENRLKNALDIPVFHDDQHGTAIVIAAAMMNACCFVGKQFEDLTVVVNGAGAAGSAIIKMLKRLKVKEIYAFDINGIITKEDYNKYNFLNKELSNITNSNAERLSLEEAMARADAFIGVSAPKLVTPKMVASMKKDPIVFAMANPEPEIMPNLAKEAGARVVGTGRSDFPNQINNLLAFPGVFRGALDSKATRITDEMEVAAACALANMIDSNDLSEDYIIPSPLDEGVVKAVAEAIATQARLQGVVKK